MSYIVCFVIILAGILCNTVSGHQSPPNYHKRSLTDPMPSSGNQRLLVLAVEYPSQKGQYPGAQWKSDFFTLWDQFYQAQSFHTLQYDIDVVTVNSAGQPVINDATSTSYIPLPSEITAYANGEYGWNFNSVWNLDTIVRDAAKYLDENNFDWTPYTQNQKVLNVIIMSAGTDYRYAQAAEISNAASDYLLSTSFSGSQYTTNTGAILNSYTFCSEHTQAVGSTPLVMAHIGQCAHEFGHALGIPDLYDVSSKSTGVGYFDLLGYGVYANGNTDGATPVGYGAYPKTALGWAQPIEVTTEGQYTLAASSKSANNFLKIYPNASDTSFYYLVENRQSIDIWDKNFVSQYSTGVLIWQVNEADIKKYAVANHVNTHPLPSAGITDCPSTPAMVLIEADGSQDMSSNTTMHYGSSKDIWQVGSQFSGPNDLAIAITELSDGVYTIHVSFFGPIYMDSIKGSGSLLPASPLLVLLLAIFLIS